MASCCGIDKVEKIGGFNKYDVEEWLRHITKAAEIKKDKKKLMAVNMLAKQQLQAAQEKQSQVALEAKVDKKLKATYG